MTTPRLGDYLREARERSGLSLEQLAERTRVRVENLAALEREDLDSLPADAYVRGFVKLVCRELRLPTEEGLALYSNLRSNSGLPEEITWAEEDTKTEPGAIEKALQDPERVIQVAQRLKRWAIPLGALLLVGLVILVVKVAGFGDADRAARQDEGDGKAGNAHESGAAASRNEVRPPSGKPSGELVPAPAAVPKESIGLSTDSAKSPRGDRSISPPPNEGLASGRSTEDAPAPPPLPPSSGPPAATLPSPVVDAPGSSGDEFASPSMDTASTSLVPEAPSIALPTAVAKGPIVLEVEALREAEVTLVLDGAGFPRKRSLMPGERKSWKADSVFVLSASDGGAIRLWLDGSDLGSAGADGQVVTNLRVRK